MAFNTVTFCIKTILILSIFSTVQLYQSTAVIVVEMSDIQVKSPKHKDIDGYF